MSVMLNEFLSAPDVVRNVTQANKQVIKDIAKVFKERGITNITTVARGTSDNAATYFKYVVEAIGEVMVSKFTPSITTVYGAKVNLSKNMVLAISQSGMSTDTLMVVEAARGHQQLGIPPCETCGLPHRPQCGRGDKRRCDKDVFGGADGDVPVVQRLVADTCENEPRRAATPSPGFYKRLQR